MKLISPVYFQEKKHSPFSLNSLEANLACSEKFEFTEEKKQMIVASTLVK